MRVARKTPARKAGASAGATARVLPARVLPARVLPARVLVVEARFYPGISDALAAGALGALRRARARVERVAVPGALEIPAAIALAARGGRYDGYVALGCVIRGETGHYDIVVGESARGLTALTAGQGLAIGNGIVTVETEAQAWDRARPDRLDKGGGAAEACLAMIALKRRFAPGAR